MIVKQDQYVAAVYCRLSEDDAQIGESESIQTQKTLLTQYCREHGYIIKDYYCDDGYTGTNFERPDFKRMISDIDKGLANMVIVKDLSRFGREYVQMGMFIEHYFDENDIRFIAVGENVDTLNGADNLVLPITNVMNSVYAKDCSRKTKEAHRARAKAGMYIGGHAPFGYIKDPTDRHHLVIDPPAAEVVQKIFRLFSEGIGYIKMTKILRDEKILNPQAYFNQNNPDYYKSDYWRKPFDWHATSIRVILSNPVYLGKTVFGRTRMKGFYQKKRIEVPEKDWIVVDGKHEAIVAQDTWNVVQQLMANKRRETKGGEIQMFAGLVKCADCNSSLNLSRYKNGKCAGFSCWVYKNYGKSRCTSHAIGWKALCTLVLEDIQLNAQVAALATKKYEVALTKLKDAKQKKETDKQKRELNAADKRIAELDKIIAKLYEDNALGRIGEDRYLTMSAAYEKEQRELKERRGQLAISVGRSEEAFSNVRNFISLIRKYVDIQELNAKILNELIEKIVVYEKTVNPDGSKSQRVDIHYKFIGFISLDMKAITETQMEESDCDQYAG